MGLWAIFVTSPTAFMALNDPGAAYLVWIGVRLMPGRQAAPAPATTRGHGFTAAFRQGMLTNVLKRNVALLYLAFLPQFVSLQATIPNSGYWYSA